MLPKDAKRQLDLIDKIRDVTTAIRNVSTIETRSILESNLEGARSLAKNKTLLGCIAAEYVNAHKAFHEALKSELAHAKNENLQVILPFAKEIFNADIPGPVTLPVYRKGHEVTLIVKTLALVTYEGEDTIGGIAAVSSLDNRSHTTESFIVKGNQAYFCLED